MPNSRWIRRLSLGGLLLFVLLVSVMPVAAHGYLVRAIPADRSVLDRAPTRVQYWFSESLEPRFSQINVRTATGEIIASGGIDPTNPTALMVQIPPGTLADGAYIVELRPAFASDSHAVVESRVFFVGEASDVAGSAASPYAQPLEIAWKTLLMLGTFLLFGVYATYTLALIPAWGSTQHALGHLPLRVITRLHILVLIGLALAVIANVLAIIQQTMTFFNVDAMTAISTDMWNIVRTGSRAGDVWTLRMVLLIVLGTLHLATWYYRDTFPFLLRSTWTGNVWLMTLIIGLQAVTSHAAGALVQPWIAVFMHWVHSLAAAFWVGGIGVLVLILPTALQPYTDEERQQALTVVLRIFSRLVVGVVALVIVSGIYNALNWFYTPQDAASTYGAALLLKILMVGLLLGFGAMHHLALHPEQQRKLSAWTQRMTPRATPRSLAWESLVGALILGAAALLSATPIPQPIVVQNETPSLTETQTIDDLTTTLSLSPGVPGINTFDIVVERDDTPLIDAKVEIQFVLPARDQRTRWHEAEQVGQGLYVWASDEINRVGDWSFLIDVAETNGTQTRIAFVHSIEADPIAIRPLTPLQVLSLVLVLVVLGWVLWPQARALAAKLNWHPATLIVAGSTVVLSLAVLWGAFAFIDNQQRQTEELLNPPPTIVNPTLPDVTSLQRGEDLYNQYCLGWEIESDFQPLLRQLDVLRDEVLYAIPARGWRKLPPCTTTLSDEQTWDVVNYLRTRRVLVVGEANPDSAPTGVPEQAHFD